MKITKLQKIITASLMATLLVVPAFVSAQAEDEDTIINANIGSTISITTSGTVNLNVTPTLAGAATSSSDTVTVATNNSAGYVLALEDVDADTDLDDGASNSIAAHAGTIGTPTTLANNSWGYRVDGAGGFGAGPTSAQSSQANLTGTWAGVPANGAADTLKTTASPAAGDTTTVWYGVKADTSKPDGTYTNTVLYTATAN